MPTRLALVRARRVHSLLGRRSLLALATTPEQQQIASIKSESAAQLAEARRLLEESP